MKKKENRSHKRRRTDHVDNLANTITDYALKNYSKIIKELESKLKSRDWMPVSEKLPIDGERVDIWAFGTRFTDAKYNSDDQDFYKYFHDGSIEKIIDLKNVTHWKIIPTQPT